MMYNCKHCKNDFDLPYHIFINHVRWCKDNPKVINREYHKELHIAKMQLLHNLYGDYKKFKVACHNCNAEFEVEERENQFPIKHKYFCSRSCANTRTHSAETKIKIANSLNEYNKQNPENLDRFIRRTINLNPKNKSVGEIEILKKLQEKFPNDGWKTGGILKNNDGILLSADIGSDTLKVKIEYDGIWHFKDIRGQLNKKQQKDKLLEDYLLSIGWRLIRISEDIYKSNRAKYFNELISKIYNSNEAVIKIY